MRILLHANAPWVQSGYGVQCRLLAPRLRDAGHEVVIVANHGAESRSAPLDWEGIPVWPRLWHRYGEDALIQLYGEIGADVAISILDAWVLDAEAIAAAGVRWIPWAPIDMEPCPVGVATALRAAHTPVVYSAWGREQAARAGIIAEHIPLMIDTQAYRPRNRAEARAEMGLDLDAFVVGIVAANKGFPARKAWFEQLYGFAIFHQRRPDSLLYVHAVEGPQMRGVDLWTIAERLGIADAMIVCDQRDLETGRYDDAAMRRVYSAIDVLSSVSMSEGFGVPIIEAQACGTPPIVGDWTAMSELLGAGWRVTTREAVPQWVQTGSMHYAPDPGAIAHRLEAARTARRSGKAEAQAARARRFALRFDADRVVAEQWLPLLDRIGTSSPGVTSRVLAATTAPEEG